MTIHECPNCGTQINAESGKVAKRPTFYETIVRSKEWRAWMNENEKTFKFDTTESTECGWLSPLHFNEFLQFVVREAIKNK